MSRVGVSIHALYQSLLGQAWGQIGLLLFSLWMLIRIVDVLVGAVIVIGERLRLPSSVLGAVVASTATSAPEFGTTVFSLVASTTADGPSAAVASVGIGSVVGSAVFNLAVIIGAIGFRGGTRLEPRVVSRDGVAYAGSVVLLLLALGWGAGHLGHAQGAVLLLAYAAYLLWLGRDTLRAQRTTSAEPTEQRSSSMGLGAATLRLAACIVVVGLACHLLVISVSGLAQRTARGTGMPEATVSSLVSLVLVAAITSLPDLLTSLAAMRRGHGSLAVGNALGSNTFDLLVCLGLPYAVAGSYPVSEEIAPVVAYLLGTTLLFLALTVRDPQLNRVKGWGLLLVGYGGFLVISVYSGLQKIL